MVHTGGEGEGGGYLLLWTVAVEQGGAGGFSQQGRQLPLRGPTGAEQRGETVKEQRRRPSGDKKRPYEGGQHGIAVQ